MFWEICLEQRKWIYRCGEKPYELIDLQNLLGNRSHVPLITGSQHRPSLTDMINKLMRTHKAYFQEQLADLQECILIDFLAVRRLMRSAEPLQIVEIGAADGILSFHLASMVGQYNEESVLCCVSEREDTQWEENVSKVEKPPKISRRINSLERTGLLSDQYDIVILNSREPFKDIEKVVREAGRLVSSEGILICLEKGIPSLARAFEKSFAKHEIFDVNSETTVLYAESQKSSASSSEVPEDVKETERYLNCLSRILQDGGAEQEQFRACYKELDKRIDAAMKASQLDLKVKLIDFQEQVLTAMYPAKAYAPEPPREVLLSIVLVASAEKEALQRCLESLSPLREQVCCELIIADTGCDTEIRQMLAGYADILVDAFPQEDPFQAGNKCTQYATGKYMMYLNSGEWLEDPDELIQFFHTGGYRECNRVSCILRNFSGIHTLRFTDTRTVRVIQRTDDICLTDDADPFPALESGNEKELHSIIGRQCQMDAAAVEASGRAAGMISKDQKKQIEDLALLLEQALGEIQSALASGKTETALQLLEDCQNSAIFLGNQIEQTQGEDFATVRYLEEYCEQIYQTYQALVQGEGENQETAFDREQDENRKTASGQVPHSVAGQGTVRNTTQETALDQKVDIYLDKLDTLAQKITESIRRDIPVRREAVFLPYKASMWDSLESVWQAADADPEWDAYVIPIPYYDRRPDGKLGQLHYEGGQFPDYVPVTGYRDYDLGERKPDVIFIHNPYDDYNRVTSVYPDFYSDVLKRYTDQLVYIPYYIQDEAEFDNRERIQMFENFFITKCVSNVNKIFMQSEFFRNICIDSLTSRFGSKSRPHWEKTLYGTGSPKIDQILNKSRQPQEIPQEWLKILKKEDGTRKKVILYNTSIGSLLKSQEKMLKKMRDVFRIFRENQSEIALLWRPHPLIKTTISSMLPTLWAEYQALVDNYRAENYGIYDDTPDANRALCLCDCYFGDGSSMVASCRIIGKPVLQQNTSIMTYGMGYEKINENILRQMAETLYMENKEINLYSLLNLETDTRINNKEDLFCGEAIWKICNA